MVELNGVNLNMAHFAKLNDDNVVIGVHVVENKYAETEANGIAFLEGIHKYSNWKQTSYNTKHGVHVLGGTPFRKNYASKGYTYDSVRDAFIRPKPDDGTTYIFNETKCAWERPVAYPNDGNMYRWDETTYQNDNTKGWVLIE